jgi:two-component system, chemotaxis family, protein-glutamate methylesterase/glutaminase
MTDVSAIDAIVMGGSAGAIDALNAILPALPADFALPVAIVLHVLPSKPSLLTSVLGPRCAVRVKEVEDKEPLKGATVYVAPPNYHVLIERGGRFALSVDTPVHYSRPAIDVLFESAADVYGPRLLAVLLSGANNDGVQGLRAVVGKGGVSVVQSPETAAVATMPAAAVEAAQPTYVLPLAEIAPLLLRLGAPSQKTTFTLGTP